MQLKLRALQAFKEILKFPGPTFELLRKLAEELGVTKASATTSLEELISCVDDEIGKCLSLIAMATLRAKEQSFQSKAKKPD